MATHALYTPPLYLALAGAVTAWYMYLVNPAVPAAFARVLRPVVVVLENKYFMDWINENILAKTARGLGIGLWKGGDRGIIEAGVVNLSWKLVGLVSGVVRRAQTGFLYHYAFVMIAGLLAFMTYFVWLK
jgi:NADH-quinone oxidoreductase subunit L